MFYNNYLGLSKQPEAPPMPVKNRDFEQKMFKFFVISSRIPLKRLRLAAPARQRDGPQFWCCFLNYLRWLVRSVLIAQLVDRLTRWDYRYRGSGGEAPGNFRHQRRIVSITFVQNDQNFVVKHFWDILLIMLWLKRCRYLPIIYTTLQIHTKN